MESETTSFWILTVTGIFMLKLLLLHVASQTTEGFISIDCGGHSGRDPSTTLDWTTDANYLQGARQLAREGVTINASVTLDRTGRLPENQDQLKTATVFYPGNRDHDVKPRSKYCYELPVEFNASKLARNYLIRATFPSSNLTTTAKDASGNILHLDAYSTRFYFSVDSTYVSTVDLDQHRPQTIELIITPLNETVYVCLVPLEDRSSMPAISALELRPFKAGMYPRLYSYETWGTLGPKSVQASNYLLFSRLNFGVEPNTPSVRYPDDEYDRFWPPALMPGSESSQILSVTNTTVVDPDKPSIDSSYDYPVKVYSTAWVGKTVESNITFAFNITEARPQNPTIFYFLNMLFFDILDSSNLTRFISIDYDPGNGTQTFYNEVEPLINGWQWIYGLGETFMAGVNNVTFIIRTNGSSQLPALINGAEIYGEFNPVAARTVPDDVEAIGNFSEELFDKSGDPCLPVPWAWIVCSVELPPRVTQINVTNKGIGGDVPHNLAVLEHLTVLDLSNNSFSGGIPLSLGDISGLRALNLESNKLSGELPPFRAKSFQNLETLSLANNQLNGSLSSLVNALDISIANLILSQNSFSGPIPVGIERLPNLQNLDFSFNKLSGKLQIDLVKLRNLQNMNLNDNHLEGTVPDSVWRSSRLELANLEQNRFTEVNLTTWYLSVTRAKSFDDYAGRRKVRLVGNPIQNVILPAVEISVSQPAEAERLRLLYNPVAFILLGYDSPWCSERQGRSNTTLIERYLCRSDEHENFWLSPSSNEGISSKVVIIIAVICGLLVAIMASVFAFLLWRMRRRTRELHQIQEALAKENVKPPFFNYEELKMATHNFSRSNILGKGGFGTVYKAEFPDGSVLAIKKLNPTEQSTSDFLNEVVNITGIKHRHLIQLKGCCVREKQRLLVYEFAGNKSLAEALWGPDKPVVLSWKQRFNICLGIARGLSYLHEELHPRMVHRDIKPQNILLDQDYNAKIADFGLVRLFDTDNTQITLHIGGTRGYCSPEYFNEGVVSEKLDVYSFGIVLLEIVSGRKCIDFKLPQDLTYLRTWAMTLYQEGEVLNLVDKELMGPDYNKKEVLLVLETALACCQLDPKKRPTISQVVNVLTKHADVAIDIVKELKGQKPYLENTRQDDMGADLSSYSEEAERRSLMSFKTRKLVKDCGAQ